MIIKKGRHYARPLQLVRKLCGVRYTNQRTIEAKVSFMSDCKYWLPAIDMYDINKLFGVSFGYHHDNSLRFGWRFINNKIELVTYVYYDGVRLREKHIAWCEFNKEYQLTIHNDGKEAFFSCICGLNYSSERIPFEVGKSISYPLSLYFGGNNPAPHNMHIEMEVEAWR